MKNDSTFPKLEEARDNVREFNANRPTFNLKEIGELITFFSKNGYCSLNTSIEFKDLDEVNSFLNKEGYVVHPQIEGEVIELDIEWL